MKSFNIVSTLLRTTFLSGLLCWLGLPLRAAPAVETSDDSPIELPKFVVTDSKILPPPEAWRYAEFPGFEVLTNASDRSTQRLLREFRMFQTAVNIVWPVAQGKSAVPTSIIICGRRNAFDAFKPVSDQSPDQGMASRFLGNREQAAIILDFQSTTLNITTMDSSPPVDGDSSGGFATEFRVDHFKQMQREYIHYLLNRSEAPVPPWLKEGLMQLFMAMQYDNKSIVFGRIEDPNLVTIDEYNARTQAEMATAAGADPASVPRNNVAEDRDFNKALSKRALMPLIEMFNVPADSADARNPLGNRWAKQCYAFVHYCLYSFESPKLQKGFMKFLERLSREEATEQNFKECFGFSTNEMGIRIRGYIDFTAYKAQEFHAKKGESLPDPQPLTLREATESEVGRIKGEALILAGHNEKARDAMIAPYIRGERDPRLLASLGLLERTAGQEVRARKFLEAALKGKVPVRTRAYVELARLRFAEAQTKPEGKNGRLSVEQTAHVLQPLLLSRTQFPALPESHLLAVQIWGRSDSLPDEQNIGYIIEGVFRFPRHLELVYRASEVCLACGRAESAADLIAHGLKISPNENVREKFKNMQAKLPPGTRTSAPAKAPETTPAK